jgi:hypothetical protein
MSEISIYKGTPTNFEEAHALAKILADSGMFDGAKGLAQAMVKVQAGAELGITPYAAMSGIHIIAGKPVLGAGLIAAKIRQSGRYDYELKSSSDTSCVINIIEVRGANRVNIGTESFTIEQARKAGVKNLDKFPKNMLFARCISNAAKFYCPDIFNGSVYVPEDFDVETKDVSHQVVEPAPAPQAQTTQAAPVQAPAATPMTDAAPARMLKPTGKQLTTLRNLLASDMFSQEERDQWENLLAKPTTDSGKVISWTKKISEELTKRKAEAKTKPTDTANSNNSDAAKFEAAKSEPVNEQAPEPAVTDAVVIEPEADDMPDWTK